MFSPENINGTPGGGSRGTAMEKINPNISVQPGETITLLDSEGPGIIQSMWFGGYTGWNFILRIYWDNMEQPSVLDTICIVMTTEIFRRLTRRQCSWLRAGE